MRLVIDIETRSTVDLRKTGSAVYAESPTTSITHVGYNLDRGPTKMWRPLTQPAPADLMAVLADPAVVLVAHNFSFERDLMTGPPGVRAGLPVAAMRPLARWDCTAARAAAIGLPRTLDGACSVLKMPVQKDAEGHALMLRVCRPRPPRKGEDPLETYWWEDEERMARMDAYCARDVDAEVGLDRILPPLPPFERRTWEITSEMNDRGILVDAGLLKAVPAMIEQAERKVNARLAEQTKGAVARVTDTGALKEWLTNQGLDEHVDPNTGKASVAKAVVSAIIEDPETDPFIREVLILRRDGGGSGARKWKAIEKRLSADGRIRGAFIYCGAASTGRWSSRGVQTQNMVRGGSVRDLMGAVRDLLDGWDADAMELIYGPPLVTAAEMQRPAFIAAPGHLLARGDYSQIEARVNPWLAGAEWKLDAFRAYDAGTGPDLYKICAAGIVGTTPEAVTGEQRQGMGKVPELALGFGGGAGALQNAAKAYRMTIPRHPRTPEGRPEVWDPEEGTDEWIKLRWRAKNVEIVGLWHGLEASALECMTSAPGKTVEVWTIRAGSGSYNAATGGRNRFERMHLVPITFKRNKSALVMKLPSGHPIVYWHPSIAKVPTPWGEKWTVHYYAEDSVTRRWVKWPLWGGLICENAVQAVARDVMAEALSGMSRHKLHPVMLVHDEGVCEWKGTDAAEATRLITDAMLVTLPWAPGLPLAVEASAGPRYIKQK